MATDVAVLSFRQNGDTAVHVAASLGRRKITRMLLEVAVDTDITNNVSLQINRVSLARKLCTLSAVNCASKYALNLM